MSVGHDDDGRSGEVREDVDVHLTHRGVTSYYQQERTDEYEQLVL